MKYIKPNGIINVYKPKGMTSFDVVAALRKILKTRKIGHTGTLDKEVEGVLPVCVGNATGAATFLLMKDKVYQCEMQFGIVTDTQDAYGTVLEKKEIEDIQLCRENVLQTIDRFVGEQLQTPPMYSAKKVNGERLYNIARQGGEIERKPVKIQILYIRDVQFLEDNKVCFEVKCSKGTYIRTLCHDIGQAFGTGGHMTALKRVQSGIFHISDATTLEDIRGLTADAGILQVIKNVEDVLVNFPKIYIGGDTLRLYKNGMTVQVGGNAADPGSAPGTLYRVYDQDALHFIGIGERQNNGYLKTKKFF